MTTGLLFCPGTTDKPDCPEEVEELGWAQLRKRRLELFFSKFDFSNLSIWAKE